MYERKPNGKKCEPFAAFSRIFFSFRDTVCENNEKKTNTHTQHVVWAVTCKRPHGQCAVLLNIRGQTDIHISSFLFSSHVYSGKTSNV